MKSHITQQQKKSRLKLYGLIFAAIVVMVVGFSLGRGTGEEEKIDIPTGGEQTPAREWSELPPLPKETDVSDVDVATNPIIIESPAEKSTVARTFTVTGRASGAAKKIAATLKDNKGKILAISETVITAANTSFARFSLNLSSGEYQGPATVEVSSDALHVLQTRHITIADPDSVTVNLYFGKSSTPNLDVCEKVFPVSRVVSAKSGVYRETIDALLAGLSPSETALGYTTEIPKGVKVKSLAVDANGVLTVDFDNGLKNVAGSCSVTAIRTQIETTLRQFPEVRDVIIMVNGSADTALQP